MPVLRFLKQAEITLENLQKQVLPGSVSSVQGPVYTDIVDITVTAEGVDDVVDVLARKGYVLQETDPQS